MSDAAAHAPIVDAALISRRSVRAFLPKPVPRADIEAILAVAGRAPSGTNTQPWKAYVLTGASLAGLSDKLTAAYDDPDRETNHQAEYRYYPRRWESPYIDRRRKVGWDLYGLLGIEKGDKTRMHRQHAQNFRFFGAPVGLMFTIDRTLELGSWLDYGMFLQSVMVAARGRGLDTCPQAAFTQFHRIIADHLGMPEHEQLVCGMSLGWADPGAQVNTLRTDRESVDGFAKFFD
jgi:nitroreductase